LKESWFQTSLGKKKKKVHENPSQWKKAECGGTHLASSNDWEA
jgi:hypothetical protein